MVYTKRARRQQDLELAPTLSATKQRCKLFRGYAKRAVLNVFASVQTHCAHSESHATRAQCVCTEAENSAIVATAVINRAVTALHKCTYKT